MKVLQLCSFTKLTDNSEMWDIKFNKDIMTLPNNYGKDYDIIISAPPCTQFTIANTRNWQDNPIKYINLANKCYQISIQSGKPWILENVIGRIEKFVPGLDKYRIGIWKDTITTKKHVIYSNKLIMLNQVNQKYNIPIDRVMRKTEIREKWSDDFINLLKLNIYEMVH